MSCSTLKVSVKLCLGTAPFYENMICCFWCSCTWHCSLSCSSLSRLRLKGSCSTCLKGSGLWSPRAIPPGCASHSSASLHLDSPSLRSLNQRSQAQDPKLKILSKVTQKRLLAQQEDMSSCLARTGRHVFLLNEKTCLPVDKKQCLLVGQEDMSSGWARRYS